MKAVLLKVVGTCSIGLGVGSVVAQIASGGELSMLPWPVGVLVTVLGMFLLRRGGEVWSARRHERAGS